MNKILYVLTLSVVVLFSSCSRNPVTGKREVSLMSEKQEIAMGKKSDPQIVAQFGLYQDEKLQAFINEKGQEMAKISHRPHLNYEFKIMDSPVVNAFAVPGGYVYFTRGIMAHFNNEAEFAGVLGHEIGHITARHSVKQMTRQTLGQVAFIGGLIVSEDFRQYAQQAQQAMGLLFMQNSRGSESQSDNLGVQYSSAIGYDAVEMADFYKTLKRLSDKNGQRVPTFLSTHPDPVDRYNKVTSKAMEYQRDNPGKYQINRNKYLKMIDGIMYGDDPKQGYTDNYVFYHPVLKFRFNYPSGWNLQNTPSMVQIAPKEGKAIINFSLAQGNDLQQVAREYAQKNKLNVEQQGSDRINGLPAFGMLSSVQQQGQNGQAQTLRILTYFIQDGQYIYMFNGISTTTDFNSYVRLMESTIKSFARLNDPSKINVKPNIVRVRPVKRTGTLYQAFKDYGYSDSNVIRDMAILNGMETNEQVQAGMLFKLIEEQGSPVHNSGPDIELPGNAVEKN